MVKSPDEERGEKKEKEGCQKLSKRGAAAGLGTPHVNGKDTGEEEDEEKQPFRVFSLT